MISIGYGRIHDDTGHDFRIRGILPMSRSRHLQHIYADGWIDYETNYLGGQFWLSKDHI